MDASPREDWPHAPSHLFLPNATYIVTGATYGKALLFREPETLDYLTGQLLEELGAYGWTPHAWAVMANHYHYVAIAPADPKSLAVVARRVHSKTAIWINARDKTPGRRVWHQYWDTCITNERSYFARLRYVNANPVHHGLCTDAEQYPWCSMAWFRRFTNSAMRKTIESFPIDDVQVRDDF